MMPTKLNPGTELTYTIDGNKIKAVAAPMGGGGFASKKGPDPKTQIIGFSMSYAKDLVVAGKIPIEQLAATFERIYNLMAAKL
jgi:hypothetical protein